MGKEYRYYTDGAATMEKTEDGQYLKGPGGWATIRIDPYPEEEDEWDEESYAVKVGGMEVTTNNEQELLAIRAAIRDFIVHSIEGDRIIIYSDSMYCINIYTQWAENWEKNDWTRGKKKEPIENLDLIKDTYSLIKNLKYLNKELEFIKVKGHSGDKFNEMADSYAVKMKKEFSSKNEE